MRKIEWIQPGRVKGLRQLVVWLDVPKADATWQRDHLYVSPGAPLSKEKYFKFGKWLDSFDGSVAMPEAGMYQDRLSFTNGRHRFSWMRDHGALAIPMSMSKRCATKALEQFGTELRVCEIHQRSVYSERLRIPGSAAWTVIE